MTMFRSLSRRRFGMLAGAAALAPALRAIPAGAQTPAATPTVDIFADVPTTPGVVSTPFGDIAVPEHPQRIVTLTDGSLDAVLALGVQPVGATAASNGESVAAYLVDTASADITLVGGWGELDIEAIVALSPDLILSDRYINYTDETLFDTLTAIAPVVAPAEIEVADANVLQQWEYEQLIWGHALGKVEEAKAAILALRERAAAIQPTLGEHTGASVVVFRPQPEFAVMMAQAWITGVMLTWSGLKGNDFTEELEPPHSGDTVGLERLNVLDADWFFAAARNADMVTELATYEQNPIFQTLSAYKSGQIALVPGDLWSGATGVLAGHAMLDDIVRIVVDGDYSDTSLAG